MKKWVPLHLHSDASLLDGLSQPKQIAKRCKELGYEACALSDHGTLAGCMSFYSALTDKKLNHTIKPIFGQEFYIAKEDASIKQKENSNSHLVVLAKNPQGWKQLVRATTLANTADLFYKKPRLDLDRLGSFADGNLVSFSGHMGSALADCVFEEPKLAYNATTYEQARKLVHPDWEKRVTNLIHKYVEIFGKDNFFVEIQLIDKDRLPAAEVVGKILRHVAKKLGVRCVATADSHYPTRQDAQDQWILLCNGPGKGQPLAEIRRQIDDGEDVGLSGFFKSNSYHIPTVDEMSLLHTEEELENSLLIASMCDNYKLGGDPIMPRFDCPQGFTEESYLVHLCREGWKKKIKGVIKDEDIPIYTERVKRELSVLQGANLSGYFLVVQDFMNAARARGEYVGIRGSAGGCMVAYLIDIMNEDPIPPDLVFERFFNIGRYGSLPDIDCDFEPENRHKSFAYAQQKYGRDYVAQIMTFSRMLGRGALKDVLRAHGACTPKEMDKITEFIPDENEINDQLEEMLQSTGEAKIIRWALQNNAKELSDYCRLEDDGSLSGPYARYFEQAMRLEGGRRSQSKHAAGVVISPVPIGDIVPVIMDKNTGEPILSADMREAEKYGFVKYDFLGVNTLSKMHATVDSMFDGYL